MKNSNHSVILVGVCGTGKSVVGKKVAQRLGVPFYDVDTLHTSENAPEGTLPRDIDIEKWLTSVEELIETQLNSRGCVISCSLLRKEHRNRLTASIDHELDWVFMSDTYENVVQRLEENGSHDRPALTLKSDFETLEVPKRALTINMGGSEQETVDTILKYLARKYG